MALDIFKLSFFGNTLYCILPTWFELIILLNVKVYLWIDFQVIKLSSKETLLTRDIKTCTGPMGQNALKL